MLYLHYTILHYGTPHYTIHYTLYTIHYTLYTTHYTLYTIHYTLYTTRYTLHTTHYTLHTTHYTLHTTHYTTPHHIMLHPRPRPQVKELNAAPAQELDAAPPARVTNRDR